MDHCLAEVLSPAATRLVILGTARYPRRREMILDHLAGRTGWLAALTPEYRAGVPYWENPCPPDLSEMSIWPHWWAASCDHITVIGDGIDSGCEHLLVMEDDALTLPAFDDTLAYTLSTAGIGWRAIRLGWNSSQETGMIATLWSRYGMLDAHDYFQRHRQRVIDRAFADLRREDPTGWLRTGDPAVITHPHAQQCGYGT